MEGLRIVIGEDEALIAANLGRIVEACGHRVLAIEHNEPSILEAVRMERPNLVLLDIRMESKQSGFNIAQKLQELNIPFLFISAHADTATLEDAAELKPLGYIVKPFTMNQVNASLTQASFTLARKYVVLKVGREMVRISLHDITYIKSDNNYCDVYVKGQRYVVRASLTALLNDLAFEHLIRIHKSFAVNKLQVTSHSAKSLFVDHQELPIGKNFSYTV